jgi:NtrC-family two-component system response regulator AlgB
MQPLFKKPSPEDTNGRILLVDDDRNIIFSFKYLLEPEGYSVYTAFREEQAKAIVREHNIDLVVLDYVLEDTTGIEIARALKQMDPGLKIVFISGFVAVFDYVSELAFHVSRVFMKPIDAETFLDTVHAVLMEPSYVYQESIV